MGAGVWNCEESGGMSGKAIPSDFVRSALQNGVGRYVCQLQRLTLKFCKSHASSRGVRDFIEQDLLEFTRKNPGVVVYLQPRRHRAPNLVGEYLNQNVVKLPAASLSRLELCKWTEHLRTRSGVDIVRLRKPWRTDTPSIQGVWTPSTNANPALLGAPKFPHPAAIRRPAPVEGESAMEGLIRVAGRMRIGAGLARGDRGAVGEKGAEIGA